MRWPWRRDARPALSAAALVEVRAALAAGATPAAALAAGAEQALPEAARALRVGMPLRDVVDMAAGGDRHAQLLLRGLAVAEHAGAGAVDAVDQTAAAARDERAVERLLRARTAQARGTATMLTALPAALALLLSAVGGAPLSYYATPVGWVTGTLAVLLGAAGLWASRRLVARAEASVGRTDPLAPRPPPRQPARLALWLPPAVVVGTALGGPAAGLLATAVAAGVALRRPRTREPEVDLSAGGTPETVELLAVALRAGLPLVAAVQAVATLAPEPARAPLAVAARRLRAGRSVAEALAWSGLAEVGRVLASCERWGAPAEQALAELVSELRAQRRAAAEIAAERVQLALIFPTTLLTLPAFALAVVPPMVWRAFSSIPGALS